MKRLHKEASRAARALLQGTTVEDILKNCGTMEDAAWYAVDLGLVSPITCKCGRETKLKAAANQKFALHGVMWKCSRCKDKTGLFAHSAWTLRKVGTKQLILGVYLWAQGMDYEQISHEAGLSYEHLCDLGVQLQDCLRDYLENHCEDCQLGGLDVVCEMHETEYGTKKKNQMGRPKDIKLDC